MAHVTEIFNAQAQWSIQIAPLLILLILNDIELQKATRQNRSARLQQEFNAAAMANSRARYYIERGLRP